MTHFVKKLNNGDSVSLFLEKSGTVSDAEAIQFIESDENYPYEEILPELKNKERPI